MLINEVNVKNLHLATIITPHGVRGQMKVLSLASEPLDSYTFTSESGQNFRLKEIGSSGKFTICAIEGVTTREAAEALKATKLYISAEAMPPLNEGEIYHAQLIGLTVQSPEGETLGTLTATYNFGAGDIVEVEFADGKTEMYPFTEAFFPKMDVVKRQITFIPPEIT